MKHLTRTAIAAAVAAILASLFATAAAAGSAHDMDHQKHEIAEADSKDGRDGGHDGSMGGCRMMRQGGKHQMGGGMMMDDSHFSQLRTELKITEAQSPAWDTYVKAAKARGDAMKAAHETHMKTMKSGDAVQRLEGHITAMQTVVDALKELKPATAALYGTLDDDQKKKANLSLGSGGCMM
jgi:LTXXQ motif family protein